MNKRLLAVIPARRESTRLPFKNKKKLAGFEMFLWTLQAAKESKLINNFILSTEDPEILKIAKSYGYASNYVRPKKLSKKNVRNVETTKHALDFESKQNRNYDFVVLLQPTSPIRFTGKLDEYIKIYLRSKCNSAVSVYGPIKKKDNFIGKSVKKKFINFKNNFYNKEIFFFNASIYITKVKLFLKNNKFLNDDICSLIQTKSESVDINHLDDFLLAEAIIKSKQYKISTPSKNKKGIKNNFI